MRLGFAWSSGLTRREKVVDLFSHSCGSRLMVNYAIWQVTISCDNLSFTRSLVSGLSVCFPSRSQKQKIMSLTSKSKLLYPKNCNPLKTKKNSTTTIQISPRKRASLEKPNQNPKTPSHVSRKQRKLWTVTYCSGVDTKYTFYSFA